MRKSSWGHDPSPGGCIADSSLTRRRLLTVNDSDEVGAGRWCSAGPPPIACSTPLDPPPQLTSILSKRDFSSSRVTNTQSRGLVLIRKLQQQQQRSLCLCRRMQTLRDRGRSKRFRVRFRGHRASLATKPRQQSNSQHLWTSYHNPLTSKAQSSYQTI